MTTFLSLPPPITEKVVLYSAGGTKGYRSLLSLRAVCKTTNAWITDLPPSTTSDIFSNNFIRLEATKDELQSFVNSPFSSIPITSLFFDSNPATIDFNPFENAEDGALWESFQALWAPRIESLELVDLPLPLTPNDIHVLQHSPNFRSLRCASIFADEGADPAVLFNGFPFNLESLTVTHINLTSPQRAEFYRQLLANSTNLKSFGTAPFYSTNKEVPFLIPRVFIETIQNLRQLVEAKQADPDFTLSLSFFRIPEITNDVQKALLFDCLRLAIDSASRIRLFCVDESFLTEIKNALELPQVQRFSSFIHSMSAVFQHQRTFDQTEFPNLNFIQWILPPTAPQNDLRLLNLSRLGLCLFRGTPTDITRLLPQTLRSLKIRHVEATPLWISNAFDTISACCPVLENLEIMCIIEDESRLPGQKARRPFPPAFLQQTTIKSFSFFGAFQMSQPGEVVSLAVAQAISNLPLQKLHLRFYHRTYFYPKKGHMDMFARPVHFSTLEFLKSPSILDNIVDFSINQTCLDPDCFITVREIEEIAELNKLRLRAAPYAFPAVRNRPKRTYSLEEDGETILDELTNFELW